MEGQGRKRERSGSGRRKSGLRRNRGRKWVEVKAGRRRRRGAGAVVGSMRGGWVPVLGRRRKEMLGEGEENK